MDNKEWIRLRVKMIRWGVTFGSVARQHGISRQRVFQIVKRGYPAKGRAKQVLDDFYGRISA